MLSHETAAFSASTSPLPARRQMVERLGVTYADLRRFWQLPAMLAAFYAVWLAVPGSMIQSGDGRTGAVEAYFGFLGTLAFLVGLASTSDDRDKGTLWFLRGLPVFPMHLLLQKLIASSLLIIGFHVGCELIYNFYQVIHQVERPLLISSLGDYRYPALWNFGVWLPLSMVQVGALVCVGIAAGSAFSNFVIAAISGLGVYVAWYNAWGLGLRGLEHTWPRGFHLAMMGQFLVLSGMAVVVYRRAVRFMDSPREWVIPGKEDPGRDISRTRTAEWQRGGFRLPWEKTATPYGRRLSMIAFALMIAGFLVVLLYKALDWYLPAVTLFFVAVPPAVLGVSAFTREELVAHSAMIYWQPVSRQRLLMERLLLLWPAAFVATLPAQILLLTNWPAMGIPAIAAIVGAPALGALARLFFRNPVFPLLLAGGVTLWWSLAFTATVVMQTYPDSESFPVLYGAWSCMVATLLPLVALYLAFTRTKLLSVGESSRFGLGVSVITSIGLAGTILITAMPEQLAWLIIHAFCSIFGINWGGLW